MKELDRLPALPAEFYQPDSRKVARRLLGKVLVRRTADGIIAGRIVETEAYRPNDPACHAHRGRTERNAVMFGPPGCAYVYLSYGMHNLLNIVCEPEGVPSAVLIRALEPLAGLEPMRRNRPSQPDERLANGPGKLTRALGVDLSSNRRPVFEGELTVVDAGRLRRPVGTSPRIGISAGRELDWRYFIADSRCLSRG